MMNPTTYTLWPELDWIGDEDLREKTAEVWEEALERSALTVEDLDRTVAIPRGQRCRQGLVEL